MLPEFRRQIVQLPLFATLWISARDRYVEERKTSSLPIRFTLAIIERTLAIFHGNVILPLIAPCSSFRKQCLRTDEHLCNQFSSLSTLVNPLDPFLCSQVDSIRYVCPLVNQTKDEVIERCSDLFQLIFSPKNSAACTSNGSSTSALQSHRNRYLMKWVVRSFQLLTKVLIIVEMYCKYVLNELNDHIEISRNLWKNLNMEDGRALEEVEVNRFDC